MLKQLKQMKTKTKCISCKKEYKPFAFSNYNLDLCTKCLDKFEENGKIDRDDWCDKVTHKITCPKCKKIYEKIIVDKKCETKDCDVWFFWDNLDCNVFARWIKV